MLKRGYDCKSLIIFKRSASVIRASTLVLRAIFFLPSLLTTRQIHVAKMNHVIKKDYQELTPLQMLGLTCVVGGIQIIWALLMGSTSVSPNNGVQSEQHLT